MKKNFNLPAIMQEVSGNNLIREDAFCRSHYVSFCLFFKIPEYQIFKASSYGGMIFFFFF